MTAFYTESYHYEIYITRENGVSKVCLAKHIHDIYVVTAEKEISDAENIILRVESNITDLLSVWMEKYSQS